MNLPISNELLEILVCPETKQTLTLLGEAEVASLNDKIRSLALKNRSGKLITEPIEGALRRKDGAYAYIVRSGIPIMLIEEGIQL